MKGVVGVKWVFLVELPDRGGYGFLLPSSFILPVAESVFEGFKEVARRIGHTFK